MLSRHASTDGAGPRVACGLAPVGVAPNVTFCLYRKAKLKVSQQGSHTESHCDRCQATNTQQGPGKVTATQTRRAYSTRPGRTAGQRGSRRHHWFTARSRADLAGITARSRAAWRWRRPRCALCCAVSSSESAARSAWPAWSARCAAAWGGCTTARRARRPPVARHVAACVHPGWG